MDINCPVLSETMSLSDETGFMLALHSANSNNLILALIPDEPCCEQKLMCVLCGPTKCHNNIFPSHLVLVFIESALVLISSAS